MQSPVSASSVIAVVPARFASSRFPGKMIATLAGEALVLHAVRNALRARRIGRVLVAADDPRVVDVVREAGFEAVLTDPAHPSGSDRIGEAIAGLDADVVVNLQGDEPLLPAAALDILVETLDAAPWAGVSTLACPCEDDQLLDPNVVKVARSHDSSGLYFSRAAIPGVHPSRQRVQPGLRHVGVYAYRRPTFERFLRTTPSPLELQEGLEQLRLLETGERIAVGLIGPVPAGVDTPADLVRCEALLARPDGGV